MLSQLSKISVHSRRLAIAAGVGLVSLLIAGAQHSMGRALEPTVSATDWVGQHPSASRTFQTINTLLADRNLGSDRSSSTRTEPSLAYAADQELHTEGDRVNYMAINTQPLTPEEAASVQQVDPTQVAVSDWQSASFPVENFQTYTSPFGYRQAPDGSYNREFHYGLDLAAPEGSYIRSWWSGTVVEVSDDSNCGTSVVIESGPWLHIYCHMQGYVESDASGRYMIDRSGGVQIWEGQTIPAGARIGRVGMTGRTTGPHLHWGLKYEESWVDPALVLRAMYASQQTANR